MFESLQNKLSSALRSITGRGVLTESNMKEGLSQIQLALLEADVSLPVVKDFMAKIGDQATGERVLKSLNPTQQLTYVVHQELVNLMGPVDHSLHFRGDVSVLMLCGLQGSGKTTTCGKLGRMIKAKGRQPLLVAADLQRPAAIQQLQVLGEQLGIPVYADLNAKDPVALCQAAVRQAKAQGANTVILDTAGRLHVDEELMDQLTQIDRRIEPSQVFLVVDAMTGQDAVHSAKAFNEALELDGVIMTKLDGDARGGAALSVKAVTGVPIKFIGTGEHLDSIEEFHPDRMAGRILGMGDVLTLVEQAQEKFDKEEMEKQQERLQKGQFTLTDFKKMLGQVGKLGPLQKVMGMIPGMDSMTFAERENPKLIDPSRRRRIATGSGVQPHEINELVKSFDGMAGIMKKMSSMGIVERMRTMRQMQSGGMLAPGGKLKSKGDTGKRLSKQERDKLKKQKERDERKKKREDREKKEQEHREREERNK
jgi:signal recognition particle subunit SRP54